MAINQRDSSRSAIADGEALEPVNILLVDDRPSNLSSLEAILRRPDYELVLAVSAHDAVAQVLRREFAVILLDVAVPGMDGFEIASLLREREKTKLVPIVFVTASAYEMEHVFRIYGDGPVDYLRKPVDAHQVRGKVAVFVDAFRQRKKLERQAVSLREMVIREQRLLRWNVQNITRDGEPLSSRPLVRWNAQNTPRDNEPLSSRPAVKILLVDDRKENLLSLASVLASADCQVVTAISGEDALKLALREDFAVILLDVMMPGLDGFRVAAHLKEVERTSRVPIIFLTAVATDMDQIYRAYAVGAVDYLIKPVDADAVRKKVAVFVDLFKQRTEIERQARLLRERDHREYEMHLAEVRVTSDKRYGKLVERINHAIAWSMDSETRTLSFVSRQAEHILGYSPAEFAEPDFWLRHVLPEDRQRLLDAFQKVSSEGIDQGVNHGFVTANGRSLRLHTGVSAVRDADDARPELHGISVDITELKRAEEVEHLIADVVSILAETFEYETAMGRLAHLLVPRLADWCVIDTLEKHTLRQLAVAHADPAKEELVRQLENRRSFERDAQYGAARVMRGGNSEIYSEPFDKLPLAEALSAEDDAGLRALGAVSYMIVPLRARGHTLAALTLVSSESGRRFTSSDLGVAEEVCARAALAIDNSRLYVEARSATRAREQILGVVSHDLKNPLNVIMAGADLLAMTIPPVGGTSRRKTSEAADNELVTKTIERVRSAVSHMARLLDDLLDIDRIDNERLAIERYPYEASLLVADCVELFESLVAPKSITLRPDVDSVRGVELFCDRERVLQVFSNLVGNAIKFTREGGTITLHAEQVADSVIFAVMDEGPGIAPEMLPHVFDRYWQAKETARLGTGLGLTIAKGIVEAHGGRIWMQSKVGEGSSVFFTLPMARDPEASSGRGSERS